MNDLTNIEKKVNKIINSVKIDYLTPKRDRDIHEILQYVTTISQDGVAEKLLKDIKEK